MTKEMATEAKRPPFFIVGCPRSGTTLLQILIDQHPLIAIPPESFFFERFPPIVDSYGDLSVEAHLRSFVCDLLSDERIRDWKLDLTPDDVCSRVAEPSVAATVDTLFTAYADRQGKRRWGDKTPQHALYVDRIRAVFPEARIIHLLRDGRDVAESMSRSPIGPNSIYGIAKRWQWYVRTMDRQAGQLPADDYLEVRFEDLVRRPTATRDLILRFIGEDPGLCQPVGDDVPGTQAARHALSAVRHHTSLNGRILGSKIGVFRERLAMDQIGVFEAVAGDELSAKGYELVAGGSRHVSWSTRLSAAVQDGVRYAAKLLRPSAIPQTLKEARLAIQHRTRMLRRGGRR